MSVPIALSEPEAASLLPRQSLLEFLDSLAGHIPHRAGKKSG